MEGKPQSEIALRGNLRIRQDLKRDIKVAAVQRGVHEYQLIEEVWKFWLEYRHRVPAEGKDLGPGLAAQLQTGHLTEEEQELCHAVMDFWRDPAARAEDPGGIGAAVLMSFVKRFRSKG